MSNANTTYEGRQAVGIDERAVNFCVGDIVRFDHFGAIDRQGLIVRLTKSAVHVEWSSPSSGITRVVKLSTKLYRSPAFEWTDQNGKVHSHEERIGSEFGSKNVRLLRREEVTR